MCETLSGLFSQDSRNLYIIACKEVERKVEIAAGALCLSMSFDLF